MSVFGFTSAKSKLKLGVKAVVEVGSGWTPENPFPMIGEGKIQPLAVTLCGHDLSFRMKF